MSDIVFNPTQCTAEQFKRISQQTDYFQEGYLYFLTDTKQLYLAKNNKYIEMCGGLNIVYGLQEIEYPTNGKPSNPKVDFTLEHLETKELPLVNDLILNSDGCFYRVQSIDYNENIEKSIIHTERLTLQGTGGGGGGSSSGGGTNVGSGYIDYISDGYKYFSLQQTTPAELDFKAYHSDKTNRIITIKLSWKKDDFSKPFKVFRNLDKPMDEEIRVPITDILHNIQSGTSIFLQTTDKFGTTFVLEYIINLVSLELTETQNSKPLLRSENNIFEYECKVGGNTTEFSQREIVYSIYSDESKPPIRTFRKELNPTQRDIVAEQLDLSDLSHGMYTLKVTIQGITYGVPIQGSILTSKVLVFKSDVGIPMLVALVPDQIEQYVKTTIPIMLAATENLSYNMSTYIDGIESVSHDIVANQIYLGYEVEFESIGQKNLKLKIESLDGAEFNAILNIVKYSSALPVIDTDNIHLKLNLNAKDTANDMVNPDIWVNKVKNSTISATLDGFYFKNINGWLKDSNNVNYLKISQGASVSLSADAYTPFVAGEISKGLTIELDFSIENVKNYDTPLIEWVSQANGKNKTGLILTGNSFRFYGGYAKKVDLNLVDNQRIRLSFVLEQNTNQNKKPMCYTYLNGIISHICSQGDSDFSNHDDNPAVLSISSTGATINIYSIRVYNTALKENTILNNYQASLSDLNDREWNYLQNNILQSDLQNLDEDIISLRKIEDPSYNLQIPYVKIFGGYLASKKFEMASSSSSNTPELPEDKTDIRAIDIEIVYPTKAQNNYFANYIDYLNPGVSDESQKTNNRFKVVSTFDNPSLNVLNGFDQKMKTGAIMYAQGTSSLEYPVKNIRVKLKNANFTVRPDIAPVELITFKADYMESSGSHNTGAANYIDEVYKNIGIATPGQEHYNKNNRSDKGKIVTCIKGHPCVIFWNPGVDADNNLLDKDDPDNYQYIGKYNFNLDKATPEPFGFIHEDDNGFGYLKDTEGNIEIENGEYINSIYCFEFLDNAVKVCNFESDIESTYKNYDVYKDKQNQLSGITSYFETDPDKIGPEKEEERYENSWYDLRINEDGDIVPGWARGFESRYPEDKIGTNDADVLYPFASWLNSLYRLRFLEAEEAESEEIAEQKIAAANEKFVDEYWKYLDEEFLLTYYLITEALLMADSRVKNMMIATWGKEWRYRTVTIDKFNHKTITISKTKPTSGDYESSYDYIWYPIFYDMDTMLGLDNTGEPKKNYYDEDTSEDVFNGDEVLWKFVRDNLFIELSSMYKRLETTAAKSFTAPTIMPYFGANQSELANEVFYNEDAKYKYVDPFQGGFFEAGKDKLYAAQGNRSIQREFFIKNRMRFLSGKYRSNQYQETDRLEFRYSFPADENSVGDLTDAEKELLANSLRVVSPSQTFNLTASKIGYAGVKIGASDKHERFNPGEEKEITLDASSANGTECYIMGMSSLSSVGDLSNKYLTKFTLPTDKSIQIPLTELNLGNHAEGYYNPYWKDQKDLSFEQLPLLEVFNFENCSGFTQTLNFATNIYLRKLLLTGSGVTTLILPTNGMLDELRIPATVKSIQIDGHDGLTDHTNFTIGSFDYNQNKYVNDFSNIEKLFLRNTLSSYSYNIIKDISQLEEKIFSRYSLQNVSWNLDKINDFEINDQDEIVGIPVLDYLMSKNPWEDQSKADSLTGIIKIKNVGKPVKEFEIYEKYSAVYPNLVIQYEEDVEIITAPKIVFYNSVGYVHYEVLSSGNSTLQWLTSLEGPNKKLLLAPNKVSIPSTDYVFNGLWKDEENNYYLQNLQLYDILEQQIPSSYVAHEDLNKFYVYKYENNYYMFEPNTKNQLKIELFENAVPTINLNLIPIFKEVEHLYTITFFDYNNEIYKTFNDYSYNTIIGSKQNVPMYLDRPDDNNLGEYDRYAFKGWISYQEAQDLINGKLITPTIIELETTAVTSDMSLCPYYTTEDARTIATDYKYFIFTEEKVLFNTEINSTGSSSSQNENLGTYTTIHINPDYRSTLSGKITLPNKTPNNKEIQCIGIFYDKEHNAMSNITELFFMEGNKYKFIGYDGNNNGFYQCQKLKRVYIPDGHNHVTHIAPKGCMFCKQLTSIPFKNVTHIGTSAFESCGQLEDTTLPESIVYLGAKAFVSCTKLQLTKLPSKLEHIQYGTFLYCDDIKIGSFGQQFDDNGIPTALSNNVKTIGTSAFGNQAGASSGLTAIYFYPGIEKINESAFEGYGRNNSGTNKITIYDLGNYFNNNTEILAQYFHTIDYLEFGEVLGS